MPTDSFSYALERLDPASRALLDLSLRRGMRTEEIAEVLGAEPESVEASRDEALRRIASDVGIDELDEVRARLAELPAEEWMGGGGGNGSAPAAGPEDADAEAEGPIITEGPKRRRRIWPLLLGLLVVAGAIVAIALATGGSDNNKTPTKSSTPSAPAQPSKPSKPAKPGVTKLRAIAGGASGTATVSGGKLHLQASGLRPGHYQAWLYNSIIDARPIGQGNGGRFTIDASLPGNWKHWRYVDVSREPRDGNISHSGESVLRVPIAQLVP